MAKKKAPLNIYRLLLPLCAGIAAVVVGVGVALQHHPKKPEVKTQPVNGRTIPDGAKPITEGKWEGYAVTEMTIVDKKYRLLVADTPEKQTLGLMYITELPDFDGMVFLFADSDVKAFWNKNTLIDLRLYWMNGDKVIGQSILPAIKDGEDPTIVRSPGAADTVVELPLGPGI